MGGIQPNLLQSTLLGWPLPGFYWDAHMVLCHSLHFSQFSPRKPFCSRCRGAPNTIHGNCFPSTASFFATLRIVVWRTGDTGKIRAFEWGAEILLHLRGVMIVLGNRFDHRLESGLLLRHRGFLGRVTGPTSKRCSMWVKCAASCTVLLLTLPCHSFFEVFLAWVPSAFPTGQASIAYYHLAQAIEDMALVRILLLQMAQFPLEGRFPRSSK